MTTLAIQSVGAITAAGPDAAQTMGAIHAGFQLFDDTEVAGADGEAITGAQTPLPAGLTVADRVTALGLLALAGCAAGGPPPVTPIPLIICAPTTGDLGISEAALLDRLLSNAALPIDRQDSRVIARGRESLPEALALTDSLLGARRVPGCYLLGADSLIAPVRLRKLVADGRVLDGVSSDGFVPGEGATALMLLPRADARTMAVVAGVGSANEPRRDRDTVSTGRALGMALSQAISAAHLTPAQVRAIAHDASGRHDEFEELALASARPPLTSIAAPRVVQPALAVGEIGAAAGVLSLAVLAFFMERNVIAPAACALFFSEGSGRTAATLVREAGSTTGS